MPPSQHYEEEEDNKIIAPVGTTFGLDNDVFYTAIIGPATALVTILLHTIGFPPLFIGTFLAVMGLLYAYRDIVDEKLLFRMLSRFIALVFFREIQSRNVHRLPTKDPIIFVCAPHNNQFLDPLVVTQHVPRPVSFIIAAKSYRDKTVGRFARSNSSIPVERPQDLAKVGAGKVFHPDPENTLLYEAVGGDEVDFVRDFQTGENARNSVSVQGNIHRVDKVISRTQILLKPLGPDEQYTPVVVAKESPVSYKIVPHIDHKQMFNAVYEHLRQGNCLGIFPEGGSHDRTDLLPIKAGVAIMALGASQQILEEYEAKYREKHLLSADATNIDYTHLQYVKIVPVGLHYYHGHRFRSRVFVEYGDPLPVPLDLILSYRQGGEKKITAVNQLLEIIKDQLRSVTVQAPSYKQLQVLWAVRRLYQPTVELPPRLVTVIVKRFAESYEFVKNRPEVRSLVEKVEKYNETLKHYGLRDHQVNIIQQDRKVAGIKLMWRVAQLILLAIFSIPGALLNFPILYLTRKMARIKAKESLKASNVKIAARDVLASWKVLTALTIVPLLLCIYPLIVATTAWLWLGYSWLTVWGNFVILQPVMMWSAVRLVETGGPIFRSIQPLYIAVTSTERQHTQALREDRENLRTEIRSLVDNLGPLIYGPQFDSMRIYKSEALRSANPQVNVQAARQSLFPVLTTEASNKLDPETIQNIKSFQEHHVATQALYGANNSSTGSRYGDNTAQSTTTALSVGGQNETDEPTTTTTPATATTTAAAPDQDVLLTTTTTPQQRSTRPSSAPSKDDLDMQKLQQQQQSNNKTNTDPNNTTNSEFILTPDGGYQYNHKRLEQNQIRDMPQLLGSINEDGAVAAGGKDNNNKGNNGSPSSPHKSPRKSKTPSTATLSMGSNASLDEVESDDDQPLDRNQNRKLYNAISLTPVSNLNDLE